MNNYSYSFYLGHGSYDQSGIQRLAFHPSYAAALRDLIGRGVPMAWAHRAMQAAMKGSHAVASRAIRTVGGLLPVEGCEVLARAVSTTPQFPGTRATLHIREAAQRASNSGAVVECVSSMSTVSIKWPDYEHFMQGEEADSFIAEVRKLWNRYPSLGEYVCELAVAWPYVETLGA